MVVVFHGLKLDPLLCPHDDRHIYADEYPLPYPRDETFHFQGFQVGFSPLCRRRQSPLLGDESPLLHPCDRKRSQWQLTVVGRQLATVGGQLRVIDHEYIIGVNVNKLNYACYGRVLFYVLN